MSKVKNANIIPASLRSPLIECNSNAPLMYSIGFDTAAASFCRSQALTLEKPNSIGFKSGL